jgi:hypothetical protein
MGVARVCLIAAAIAVLATGRIHVLLSLLVSAELFS